MRTTADRGERPRVSFAVALVALLLVAVGLAAVQRLGGREDEGRPRGAARNDGPDSGGSATPTPPAPPPCRFGDAPAPASAYGDWDETVLDTRFRLPPGYEPPDLVSTAEAGFAPHFRVRAFVVRDLRALGRAAEAAGHAIEILAAYRSFEQQRDLLARRTAAMGEERARLKTAVAGHSEHQLGTAVDFKSRGATDVSVRWGSTPPGRWMAANAHRFGFVLSYPKGKARVTCYPYEPWHFRYLGGERAREIHRTGVTIREHLWALSRR